MAQTVKQVTITIAGVEVVEEVAMREVGGKMVYDGPSSVKAERRAALRVAEKLGATGEVFSALRRVLPMKARELAPLLDTNEFTISRWETGKGPVQRNAFALLCAMVDDALHKRSDTADRLRALAATAAE